MTILLANDDGIDAPGLEVLRAALSELGRLLIVAPDGNRSGAGSSVSVTAPFRAKRYADGPGGEERWAVSGTPADAVKYGLSLLAGEKPRLVAAGVNYGLNIGLNVRNSGTLGAALEAAWAGVPALAVSADYRVPPCWDAALHYARVVAERLLDQRGPALWSLNVPMTPAAEVKGLRLTRQGISGYEETFEPGGSGEEFVFTGRMLHRDTDEETDGPAVRSGYASLTPLTLDYTDYDALDRLRTAGWGGA